MAYSAAGVNSMLNNLGSAVVITNYKISAHFTDPGATGTNECTGSTRATGVFAAASAGQRLQSNAPTVTGIPIAESVQYLGVWDNTGTTYLGKQAVTPTSASGGSGTWSYDVAAGTLDLLALALA